MDAGDPAGARYMGGRGQVFWRINPRYGAATVEVRLLGPLEVRLGDGPVELGPRKQRAVLAMLALEPGRTVRSEERRVGKEC